MRRLALLVLRRLALLVVALAALAVAPGASARFLRNGYGLQLTSIRQIDPRLVDVTVRTAALPQPVSIYILLPPGYDRHVHRRYPVLYLLPGTSGHAADWTTLGGAEQVIGNRPLLTVMPDIALNGEGGGWCTDWPNGAERWETFHIAELIPWIDANWRTIATRGERAIAGVSQGGFCATSYAARHPDLFSVVLGYSPVPDIFADPAAQASAKVLVGATEVALDHVPSGTFFGPEDSNGINWAAHDPATLAENLRETRLYMYWGNGQTGPLDSGSGNSAASFIEDLVWADNNAFQQRLDALGIPGYFDDYGPGTDSWPYWERDLGSSITRVAADLAHPWGAPKSVTYTSGDDSYSVYGWTVVMHRSARELSTLANADNRGLELSGSGSATVTTAPVFIPNQSYQIVEFGPHVERAVAFNAGPNGRLRFEVPLGPSNPYPEFSSQAQSAGTAVYTTSVMIYPA